MRLAEILDLKGLKFFGFICKANFLIYGSCPKDILAYVTAVHFTGNILTASTYASSKKILAIF
jgi:hypothetical protein